MLFNTERGRSLYGPGGFGTYLFDAIPSLIEAKLQDLVPQSPGYYRNRFCEFLLYFMDQPENRFHTERSEINVIGAQQYHDPLLSLLVPEKERFERHYHATVGATVVFVGDGPTMNDYFRSIGSSKPPHELAIFAMDCCYYNKHWLDTHGFASPIIQRGVRHEYRHVLMNKALTLNPYIQTTNCSSVLHEAFGGPLDPLAWVDVPQITIDFSGLLQDGSQFWPFYSQKCRELGYDQDYFSNPVAAAFYRWVASLGEQYWINLARNLMWNPQVINNVALERGKQRAQELINAGFGTRRLQLADH